jgi:uncharacterized membrane protein
MVLATIDGTGYKIVLIVHIVLMFVAFGALFAAPMLGRAEGATRPVADAMAKYLQRIAVPALAVAGILGFGLIGMSDKVWEFKQRWVGIAILLWIVELAVLWFGVAATEKKVAAGDATAEARMPMFTGISHLAAVVLVYLMVFKPGL